MAPMDRYLPRLSEPGRIWARFFALLALIALLTWVALVLRRVLTPVVAALALAYILNPLVTWLEHRYRVRRAVSITVGLALLLLASVLLATAGTVQIVQLAGDIPDYAKSSLEWLDRTVPGVLGTTDTQPATETQAAPSDDGRELARVGRDRLLQLASEHGLSLGSSVVTYIGRVVSNAFYWLSLTVLLPLYTFFFLLRFNVITAAVRDHLPAEYRPTIVRIATTIDEALSTFFRGRLLICLAVGTLTGVGWLIIDVPYNLALGALVGVLNLVPFLSVLALPPALILTYLHASEIGANWVVATGLVVAVYMAAQAMESFVLSPVILSKTSGLHPITTVIVLLIGAELAGLLGMLLAIPIASTLKSLASEYALPELRRLATSDQAAPPGAPDAPAGPVIQPAQDRKESAPAPVTSEKAAPEEQK